MKVVKAYPPLYPQIAAAFKLRPNQGVIFSWGDTIFVPDMKSPLSAALLEHEYVHGPRQLTYPGGVNAWWDRYIKDQQFRLDEEVPAHRAEFAWHRKNEGRHAQDRALTKIALRLSSALYGNLVTFDQAKELVVAL